MNACCYNLPKFITGKGKKNKVVETVTNRVYSLRSVKVFSSQKILECRMMGVMVVSWSRQAYETNYPLGFQNAPFHRKMSRMV
jgi:hypothetical protein